jgi:tRNA (adenine57-N1/adenine58-N1)-methyltransferase
MIQAGDLVVIIEAFDRLGFVYAQRGAIIHNRNGAFYHDDFIDKQPFGCKIRSRTHSGYGFLYLLKPTPELWTRSLNHRTQIIVHELDQAQVLFQLHIRPNMTVLESGTGSGAMSHAILRTIAPQGQLHTFEFNQHRVETARKEF